MVRCEIDPGLGDSGKLEIEFGFPGFCRPNSLGTSEDDRPLSCWFSFVRLYTTDMYKPGPWFPPSHHDISVVGLAPPSPETGDANIRAEPANYTFGRSGTVLPFLRDGWSTGDNFAWTEGSSGRLELPGPTAFGTHVLRVEAFPLIIPDKVTKQDVTILLDRIVIGQYSLHEPSAWVLVLPRELTEGRESLPLTFVLPDAGRAADFGASTDVRRLGIAVTRISVLPLPEHLIDADSLRAEEAGMPRPIAVSREFMMHDAVALPAAVRSALGMDAVTMIRGFESLGTDREFGLVQRKLGLEVLNLFRFCEGTPRDLTHALTDDLRAATNPDQITVELNDADPPEYVLAVPRYKLKWQMLADEDDTDRDSLRHTNAFVLSYLRRKFFEGLRAGRKIYVLKQKRPIPIGQAVAILMELNRCGHAILLCVEEAADKHRPGEVELLMPALMRGYIKQSTPDTDVEATDPAVWLRLLANATLLKRGPNTIVVS
jgi:hypothetical protein